MKNKKLKKLNNSLALILVGAVVLSGLHAKDLANLPASSSSVDHAAKVGVDLHNHIDKFSKTLVKTMSDNQQADNRSLRQRTKHAAKAFNFNLLSLN